jgi:hypothetical protein
MQEGLTGKIGIREGARLVFLTTFSQKLTRTTLISSKGGFPNNQSNFH